MKKLVLFAFVLVACTSTDNEMENGICRGSIRDVGDDGTVYHDVRIEYFCNECGRYIYWECPEPGTCEYHDAIGIFECDL